MRVKMLLFRLIKHVSNVVLHFNQFSSLLLRLYVFIFLYVRVLKERVWIYFEHVIFSLKSHYHSHQLFLIV